MTGSYKYPRGRILQFARHPNSLAVKSRLSAKLTPWGRRRLHRQLMSHVYHLLSHAQLAPVDLWISQIGELEPSFLKAHFSGGYWPQPEGDLGERMYAAFQQTLAPIGSADFAIIVGSDCPFLTVELLDRALAALHAGRDAVLGPAIDGGYYLLGLKRAQWDYFDAVDWGSPQVFQQTLERLNGHNLMIEELEVLTDIDRPDDLKLLENYPFSQPLLKNNYN